MALKRGLQKRILRLEVVPAGLTREPHAAVGLAFPGFVELAGAAV
jgi:hypothetical protein